MKNNKRHTQEQITQLMTDKVRELNHTIDHNITTYINEVANSRAVRSNLINNIREDALSINQFIDNFHLTNVQPHFIAQALALDPDQNILDLMSSRAESILEDTKAKDILPDYTMRYETDLPPVDDDIYFDDVNYQGDFCTTSSHDNNDLGKQTTLTDYLGEIDITPIMDDADAIFNSTHEQQPDNTQTKRPRRTYSLVIDNAIDNRKDGKYIVQTTLYVSPKGDIVDDADQNVRQF